MRNKLLKIMVYVASFLFILVLLKYINKEVIQDAIILLAMFTHPKMLVDKMEVN